MVFLPSIWEKACMPQAGDSRIQGVKVKVQGAHAQEGPYAFGLQPLHITRNTI